VKALYDYANVHHHLDLRFSWLAKEDDKMFIDLLLNKLDEYIKDSTRIFKLIFKLN
jgi:hypothetical protein